VCQSSAAEVIRSTGDLPSRPLVPKPCRRHDRPRAVYTLPTSGRPGDSRRTATADLGHEGAVNMAGNQRETGNPQVQAAARRSHVPSVMRPRWIDSTRALAARRTGPLTHHLLVRRGSGHCNLGDFRTPQETGPTAAFSAANRSFGPAVVTPNREATFGPSGACALPPTARAKQPWLAATAWATWP
jgi:hypothetical protein